MAAFDHSYTLFLDDDLLPGRKCLEGFYHDLGCYLLPRDESRESNIDKWCLNRDFALCDRPDHLLKRQQFINRIITHGWKPLIMTGIRK